MKLYHLLLCFLLYSLSSFAQEWKKVGDDTYSIEIPADWFTKPIDKTVKRASDEAAERGLPHKPLIYEKYNLQVRHDTFWQNPSTKEISTWSKAMYLRIQCFTSENNSTVPFHIVEELVTSSPVEILDTQRKECGKGKVKVVVLEKNMEINRGKIKRYNLYRYILLQQSERDVHAVEVSISEKHLKEHPEKMKEIERILNSFEIK